MFQHALEHLISIQKNTDLISKLIIVTQYDEIEQYVLQRKGDTREMIIVRNEHSERGISSSLQLGLQAAADADACLFCVSDQPYLKEETVTGLIHGFCKANMGIGCVTYEAKHGNPTIFKSRYYEELLKLSGDLGGRQIIERYPNDVYRYQMADENELKDIDYNSGS